MEIQNPTQSPSVNVTTNAPQTFSIAGIVTLPVKHASMVATVGAIFTLLYLLDLFLDINPVKDMYLKVFPREEVVAD